MSGTWAPIFLVGIAMALGVALVYALLRLARSGASEGEAARLLEGLRGELQTRSEALERRNLELQTLLSQQLSASQQLLQDRLVSQESALREQLVHQAASMQGQTGILQRHMEGTQATLAQVTEKVGMVAQTSARMAELGREMEDLQRLLRSPKARGILGEVGLESLLSDMLPRDRVTYQYGFSDGEKVDAMVRLDRGLLPIDAKFPLEDFLRYIDAPPESLVKARKAFRDNVRKKVDSVASKYIRPGEGTLPLALVYFPAESIYYEAFVVREKDEEDLWQYAYGRSVLPLSPGTLAAYVKTVALGLKAAVVEQNAREVLQLLATLERDLAAFRDSYDTLGRHIGNAHQKYDENARLLQRFQDHLERAKELGQEEQGGPEKG